MRKVGEILEVVVKNVTEKREKWKADGEPEDFTDLELMGMWVCGEIDIKPGESE